MPTSRSAGFSPLPLSELKLTLRVIATLLLPFATLADAAAQTGTIHGTVKYTGVVPEATKILTTDGGTILHNDLVVDAKTKGLRFVVVQIEDAKPKKPAKADSVVIDQRDMVFLPRVIAVQEGNKVRFENNDLSNHGVQTFSRKPENAFNVTLQPNQPFEHEFKADKMPVVVGCQIHAWMRAWVYVLPHPHFAVTDARGQFKIADVPAGKHTLVFAHPDTGLKERRTVEVVAGRTAEVMVEWSKDR